MGGLFGISPNSSGYLELPLFVGLFVDGLGVDMSCPHRYCPLRLHQSPRGCSIFSGCVHFGICRASNFDKPCFQHIQYRFD